MKLLLRRDRLLTEATLGTLQVNGNIECYTLEDTVRALGFKGEGKVAGQTAIPAGTYRVIIDNSVRFGKPMPHILNVPFFEGIRIHPGNTAADTAGCILVGCAFVGPDRAQIGGSRIAFERLMGKLTAALTAKEKVTITIQ